LEELTTYPQITYQAQSKLTTLKNVLTTYTLDLGDSCSSADVAMEIDFPTTNPQHTNIRVSNIRLVH
jgi:hypothetical protein